jgi:uncharacterized protein YecE (DUF72 family)
MSGIHLGTSAFTAAGWEGSFHPADFKPAEYLSCYAQHFDTVGVDSTFYRTPKPSTVPGWNEKTANNHYAGHAPATAEQFQKLLKMTGGYP